MILCQHFSAQRLFCLVSFFSCILFSGPALTLKAEEAAHSAGTEIVQKALYEVSNETLIQSAQEIYEQASQSYLTQLRGLTKSQLRLQQVRQSTESIQVPEKKEVLRAGVQASEQKVLRALEQSERRLSGLEQQMDPLQREKNELEGFLDQIQKSQESTDGFLEVLSRLDQYLFEIRLRLQDQTLSESVVPSFLTEDNLEKHRQNLQAKTMEFDQEKKDAHSQLQELRAAIDETQDQVAKTRERISEAEEHLRQEQRLDDLAEKYSALRSETAIKRLQEMDEERAWLQGSLTLSLRRFRESQTTVQDLRDQIPRIQPGQKLGVKAGGKLSEETQEAIQAVKTVLADFQVRILRLIELQSALERLLHHAEGLQSEIKVLEEHLSIMQVMARVVLQKMKTGTIAQEAIPDHLDFEHIQEVRHKVQTVQAEANTAVHKATQRLSTIQEDIEAAKSLMQEAKERRARLQERYQASLQVQKWDQELRALNSEQIASKFQELWMDLLEKHKLVQQLEDQVQAAISDMKAKQSKLTFLQDPLLRSSEPDLIAQKEEIREKLMALAVPEEKTSDQPLEDTETGNNGKVKAKQANVDQYIPLENLSDAQGLQDLLSTRIRVIQKQQEYQANLRQSYTVLSQKLDDSIAAMDETQERGHYAYAIAVEVKKRLGQNTLPIQDVPTGITKALNQDLIQGLDSKREKQMAYLGYIQDQIKSLDTNTAQDNVTAQLVLARDLLGLRIDVLKEARELKQSLRQPEKMLTGSTKTSLKQQALRRMKGDNAWKDSLLGFITNPQLTNLTALLQSYYQELIDSEARQEILVEHMAATEKIIQLAQDEKTALTKAMSQLQAQRTLLLSEYDREWVLINARLNPSKADEILAEFKVRTGERLPKPKPLPEDRIESSIKTLTEQLYLLYLEIHACDKWIAFFQRRLSPQGIKAEADMYQDQLGALNSQESALMRHIKELTGREPHADGQSPNANASGIQTGQIAGSGEIHKLRLEIEDIRQQETLLVLIKLAVVILLALVLNWMINRFMDHLIQRTNSKATSNAQTYFVLSFSKASSKVIIWLVTVILVFSFLGFNVTAVLAGLGIGGLAVAMAARETIANILGGIMIFLERPFNIGDVVEIGSSTAKVQGISWRSTRLTTPFGYTIHIPNSHVTESTITNFTKMFPYGDFISIYVSPKYDPQRIMALINQALEQCISILGNKPKGAMLAGSKVFDNVTLMEYWPYWHIEDYLGRNAKRHEVWQKIWDVFSQAGIHLHFSPYDLEQTKDGLEEEPKKISEQLQEKQD